MPAKKVAKAVEKRIQGHGKVVFGNPDSDASVTYDFRSGPCIVKDPKHLAYFEERGFTEVEE